MSPRGGPACKSMPPLALGQGECQPRVGSRRAADPLRGSTRGPTDRVGGRSPPHQAERARICPMDASALSKLLSPEGWALLGTLPEYHPDAAMAISERLRTEGFDTELVAAALTQSRLRAKAREKLGEFAE